MNDIKCETENEDNAERKNEIRKMEITKIKHEIASTANMIDYSQ